MQTFYLKYRPARIADLDLVSVRNLLTSMLSSGNFPHAWLFTGPRGTGKTSSARILAKAINCIDRQGSEPCGKCESCVTIASGSSVDVIEIDAASNRGIDDIRQLREQVGLSPMKAKYKVYVIDEVHMLTTEAANALLKTLEEPPAYVVFVLCTTDPEKLPETVVSRCTRVHFLKPTMVEAVASLAKVVTGEKMKVAREELELVAKSAKGSFRDATKILEQVSLSGMDVKQVLGLLEVADPEKFVDLLIAGSVDDGLKTVAAISESGVALRGFVERVVEVARKRLLADLAEKDKWLKIISDLDLAYDQMRTATVVSLPLEIVVIENCKTSKNQEIKVQDPPVVAKNTTINNSRPDVGTDDLKQKWPEVLKAVRPMNHSVEALLKSTRVVNFDGRVLTLEVFYTFHKDKLETEKCRKIVIDAVSAVMGSGAVNLKLIQSIGAKKPTVEDLATVAENIFVDKKVGSA